MKHERRSVLLILYTILYRDIDDMLLIRKWILKQKLKLNESSSARKTTKTSALVIF